MHDAHPAVVKHDIRLVAVDLDGTLLDDDKRVCEKAAVSLRALSRGGVRVVIASARPPRSVRHIYRALELDTWQVNYNGALIWDEPAGKAAFHRPLAGDLVAEIVSFARGYDEQVQVSCEVMDRWFTDTAAQPFTTETGRLFRPDVIAPLASFVSAETTKLLLLGPPATIDRLEPLLIDRFLGRALVLRTDPHLVQLANPAAGKSAALQRVIEHYGVKPEQLMAVGDMPNDVGMLQLAGVAVAMGNAHPSVKAVADWIAPDNNDHGVHAALVRYLDV